MGCRPYIHAFSRHNLHTIVPQEQIIPLLDVHFVKHRNACVLCSQCSDRSVASIFLTTFPITVTCQIRAFLPHISQPHTFSPNIPLPAHITNLPLSTHISTLRIFALFSFPISISSCHRCLSPPWNPAPFLLCRARMRFHAPSQPQGQIVQPGCKSYRCCPDCCPASQYAWHWRWVDVRDKWGSPEER